VALLILAEAMLLAAIGGAIGMALTPPVVKLFHAATIGVFAKMPLVPETFYLQAACALVVGVVAGIVPAFRASRVKIVEGLRHVA
jgi:putative ABC transport system permease protein